MQYRQNLFGLNQQDLDNFFSQLGEKPHRTKQFMQWVYHQREFDFDKMSNLDEQLKDKLKTVATLDLPRVVVQNFALDGVIKWVLDLGNQNHIETIYIPEKKRGTLCISSQIGCALACTFCSTGKQGFNRNLSTAEMITQVMIAQQYLHAKDKNISNVVFMGMGEPLLNENAVYQACGLLLDDLAFGLSRRKVTISTSGIVPALYRLAKQVPVSLAISLHAANDALRNELVPINQKYPLKELLAACQNYLDSGTQERHILFEYVMLEGVNDSAQQARQLAKLLYGIAAKVNLIPFNLFPKSIYRTSKTATIKTFQDILFDNGIRATTRRVRGGDVLAACGQLAGKVVDKSGRSQL